MHLHAPPLLGFFGVAVFHMLVPASFWVGACVQRTHVRVVGGQGAYPPSYIEDGFVCVCVCTCAVFAVFAKYRGLDIAVIPHY